MKRKLYSTGPLVSVLLGVAGVAAGMAVGMLTPPLSGGTIAALALVALGGSIWLRLLWLRDRRAGTRS